MKIFAFYKFIISLESSMYTVFISLSFTKLCPSASCLFSAKNNYIWTVHVWRKHENCSSLLHSHLSKVPLQEMPVVCTNINQDLSAYRLACLTKPCQSHKMGIPPKAMPRLGPCVYDMLGLILSTVIANEKQAQTVGSVLGWSQMFG